MCLIPLEPWFELMSLIGKPGRAGPEEGGLHGPSCSQHHSPSTQISVVLSGGGAFTKGKCPPPSFQWD